MFERFTTEARQVLVSAADLSRQAGARSIDSRFVLAGVLTQSLDATTRLRSAGVDVARLLAELEHQLGPWARFRTDSRRRAPALDEDAKLMVTGSLRAAARLGDHQLEARHLVLGMLDERTRAGSVLARSCADVQVLTDALARPPATASEEDTGFGLIDRFSEEAKHTLVVTQSLALGVNALEINSRHLLLALMKRSRDVEERLLSAGVDTARLEEQLWHEVGTYSQATEEERRGGGGRNLPFGRDAKVALEAIRGVVEQDGEVESRHLVLAMLSIPSQGRGALVSVLPDPDALRRAFERAAGDGRAPSDP